MSLFAEIRTALGVSSIQNEITVLSRIIGEELIERIIRKRNAGCRDSFCCFRTFDESQTSLDWKIVEEFLSFTLGEEETGIRVDYKFPKG
jgi:hypothetical protein